MNKILCIGQAPTDQKQEVPYSTTMIYEWLNEVGINKEKAQEMFEWEAVSDKFPGKTEKGHNKPSQEDMDEHWKVLEQKVQLADKVWLLGNIAADYFESKEKTWSCNMKILRTMHPSKRNRNLYKFCKTSLIQQINNFLNE